MRRRRLVATMATAAASLCAVAAHASGGPPLMPQYIDHHGGTAAELAQLYRGRTGLIMGRSHAELLYLQWRLLHRLEVGSAAGGALAPPPVTNLTQEVARAGSAAWLDARALVPGLPEAPWYIPMDRRGPDFSFQPNCFDDAFDLAAATLRDRVHAFGANAAAVRAWVVTQDAVFDACGSPSAVLPPVPADAPAWLRTDRAYQEAAFALYHFRAADAAIRFATIARDRTSPWQPRGLYLAVRAIWREAMVRPDVFRFALARRVIGTLARAPAGTYGQSEVPRMLRALDYRDRPAELLVELDRELSRSEPSDDVELALRDYLSLSRRATTRPDAADWIFTLQASERRPALDHARARWAATRDAAWLVAALSLATPGDAEAAALAADAAAVEPDHPAWLTAQYHLIRLTIAGADPAATRTRLDRILARSDLTLSERNVFAAARTQVARDLDDFVRFALRRPYCVAAFVTDCGGDLWDYADEMLARNARGEWVGFGADARAAIDRMPLADRIALSRHPAVPRLLRLDLALTAFTRAVLLQDDRSIDGLARDLAALLPQMRRDWQGIVAQRPGPAKRFAEYFAMAKIPGLRADFVGYVRPRGTVRQFQGYWSDWLLLPRGSAVAPPQFVPEGVYRSGFDWYGGETAGDGVDLACLDQCGPGGFPFRPPPFLAPRQHRAVEERARMFLQPTSFYGDTPTSPAGAVSIWEEVLAYARAHPRDPRSPEALYWLIRIARWGGNHNHSGRRAFQLLHRRYPGSTWARRSPYYYDS